MYLNIENKKYKYTFINDVINIKINNSNKLFFANWYKLINSGCVKKDYVKKITYNNKIFSYTLYHCFITIENNLVQIYYDYSHRILIENI